MKTLAAGMLLLLAIPTASPAADGPTMADPLQVPEGEPIEIASGVTVPDGWAAFHIWKISTIDAKYGARGRWYDKHGTYAIWALPGRYEVEHTAVLTDWENKQQTGETEYRTVVVTPRGPPPVVTPPTEPVPGPGPVEPPVEPPVTIPPGKRLVAVVYESEAMRIPLQVHAARQQLEALGHQVRVIDKDVTTGGGIPPKELTDILRAANQLGKFPSLIVSTGERVIRAVELPATAEAIVREATK